MFLSAATKCALLLVYISTEGSNTSIVSDDAAASNVAKPVADHLAYGNVLRDQINGFDSGSTYKSIAYNVNRKSL